MTVIDRLVPILSGLFGGMVVLIGLLCVSPAQAQFGGERVEQDRSPRYQRQGAPSTPRTTSGRSLSQSQEEPASLPDWAEPASPSGNNLGPQPTAGPPCPGGNCGGGDDPGRNVPLGGLEWLFAAGAGYGLWKLRDEE